MEDSIKRIAVKLPNGAEIQVEVTPLGIARDADVASIEEIAEDKWQEVTNAVEGIAQWVGETLQKVHPTKASVEFGIEIGIEPGKVTALWVKGSAKANLKITLEWSEKKD